MTGGVSQRSEQASGPSLHYESTLPAGLTVLVLLLLISALGAVMWPALDAGMPAYVLTFAGAVIGGQIPIVFRRRVTLTADGRLLITGLGQRVDVEAGRITAITVSRRGRLGFGSAVVHWDGGKFRLWLAMKYTPVPRSAWSLKYVSGRGGKDFSDLVYRLRWHNPALAIEGVAPPVWARPPVPPQPPRWW